jgi:tRNA dimethylallyltransferase
MAGEIIGLDGIVNDQHSCDAVALEDAEVCVMPFDRIEEISREVTALQSHVHKIMSREIVREHGVMLLLGSMRAEERLAAFLLNLTQRLQARGFSASALILRMTREEIGSYLGLKLETVSRLFSKFQDEGLMEVNQKHVRIADIAGRGAIPIICGGAGLYARALTHGLSDDMPVADPALRASLENEPLPVIVERLRALDPAGTVDEKNRRRVVRALEVCIATGQPFSSFRKEWDTEPTVRGVILSRPRAELLARIEQRTEAMFSSGVVAEVAEAKVVGFTAEQMLGLREIRSHIAGDLSLTSCKTAINIGTRQYAKRQATWFRRERQYTWMNLSAEPEPLRRLVLMATIIS